MQINSGIKIMNNDEWANKLLGTTDDKYCTIMDNTKVLGEYLRSNVNGKIYKCGTLTTPSLSYLQQACKGLRGKMYSYGSFIQEVGDVRDYLNDIENTDALFQVASQFNALEMVNPTITPHDGVNIYAYDNTQGPICAIACGAGTIYRNYYAPSIDTLWELERELRKFGIDAPWKMVNGYAIIDKSMVELNKLLDTHHEELIEIIMGNILYPIQQDMEVTTSEHRHSVSQIFCSALPISYQNKPYNNYKKHELLPFSKLLLEGLYEATLLAGVLNLHRTGCNKVFLTQVGGGVFGNDLTMIDNAISRALELYSSYGLDVVLIKYER